MSQSDDKLLETVKVVGIFGSMALQKSEKNGQDMEMEDKEGQEVKELLAEQVTVGSKLEDEVAESDSEDDEDDQEPGEPEAFIQFLFDPEVPEVVLNEYVIAEIGQFLDFYDLRSLRQLNKLWAAGATPQFVQKAAFVLRSGKRREDELEAFEKETKDLKGITALKILSAMDFAFEKEAQLFNDILAYLSPSLKSLELEAWWNDSIFFPRATIQLQALTSLIFDSRHLDIEPRARLFELLYTSAPNLTELDVLELDSAILSPLFAKGSRNWARAPNLKWLRVRHCLSPEELLMLVQFPQNWERLDISVHTIGRRRNESLRLLSRLLDANKDSLVGLNLTLNTNDSRVDRQTLLFPNTFSKLEELKLEFWDWDGIIILGGDRINYSKTFPSLTSLSLKSFCCDPYFTRLAVIWVFFFPPQVFRGLKYLELDSGGNYDQFVSSLDISENWAEIKFPNAKTKFS